ncbi:4Fe-4S dicluster domain-containing protein [bacterium]|nr:MAG: 4Fe-4S dicluster domain-containing protein [bacterium]
MSLDYLGVSTLGFDREKCVGCLMCIDVCPHGVFVAEGRAVKVENGKKCMECGACVKNCPAGAVSVKPGVGCAEAILTGWIKGGPPQCGCSGSGCC